ncbi:MAG: nucleotidyl transferase AbiEii/AbiGii toxin family protein [Candidatus Nealsonbacteria bacterium]|nr:nucleotidyl transferase AbiEii/AbiGii toxin family protein [Candidatus Nealsonbacteria bacterium]
MYSQTITKSTAAVLEKIAGVSAFANFYLAGGTALALQLGHRVSVDLDLFSPDRFSNADLKKTLASLGKFEVSGESQGTINGILDNVKASFFYYDYKLLFPFVDFQKVRLADERDIAAMKISAVSSRGSRKDFIDIYFLLEKYALGELVAFFESKYKNIKYNKLHILKSLTYFEEADNEPMPKMLKSAEWGNVKEKIVKEANRLLGE